MTQTVKKELLAQLQHLRTEVKEISRLYVANLQRDIVELIEFLSENHTTGKNPNSRATNPILSQMKETLDEISLKPEKGRRKDLRKIEQAVRSMRKIALSDKRSE
jgi:hypothetical protein